MLQELIIEIAAVIGILGGFLLFWGRVTSLKKANDAKVEAETKRRLELAAEVRDLRKDVDGLNNVAGKVVGLEATISAQDRIQDEILKTLGSLREGLEAFRAESSAQHTALKQYVHDENRRDEENQKEYRRELWNEIKELRK